VFKVYGPKIFSQRRTFRDPALENRCVTHVTPMLSEDDFPDGFSWTITDVTRGEAQALRNKLALWRFRNWRTLAYDPTIRIPGLEPRLQETSLALFAVAGENAEWRDVVTHIAREVNRDAREARRESPEGWVVDAIVALAEAARRRGYYFVRDATAHINGYDPWAPGADQRRPSRHDISEDTVGRILRGLLGQNSSRQVDQDGRRRRAYEFNAEKLARLRATYDAGPLRLRALPPAGTIPRRAVT